MTHQHRLTDRDGDRLLIHSLDGLYVTVSEDDRTRTAGPFTRAELVEALDAVAPAGRSTGPHVHHEALGGYKRSDDYPQGGLVQALPEGTRQYLAEQDELRRLGRLVEGVRDDGHSVQVDRVLIAPCDTRGRTRAEVALQLQLDRGGAEAAELCEKLADAEHDRDEATAAMEQMARDIGTIRTQRDTARADRDAAQRERDAALTSLQGALDSHEETLRDIASGKYTTQQQGGDQ